MTASYDQDKQQLLTRLRRIEGQVRGIQRMLEEDKYCVDILTQISGVQSALQQVGLKVLEDHLLHCVTDAIRDDNGEEKIREVVTVLQHYTKTTRTVS
jgi:CsoR family transcriptional regulator, copper-sensing transcriptional repressor